MMNDYQSIALHPALVPYIREIHVDDFAEETPHVPICYKVLPGPSPVAGFQYRGRLGVLRDGREQTLNPSGITGLQSTGRSFVPRGDTRTILIVFEPYGAGTFLRCPMNEVAGEHIGLDSILPAHAVRLVSDQLADARTSGERSRIVQSFLVSLLDQSRQRPHALVVEATQRISRNRGRDQIEGIAADLAVSKRHLERLFQRQIGVGPKELASLVRFDWLLQQLPRRRSWASLAYEAGFADQAHFVRHFVARTGATPEEYARQIGSARCRLSSIPLDSPEAQ